MTRAWLACLMMLMACAGEEGGEAVLGAGEGAEENGGEGEGVIPCPEPARFEFGGCEITCVGFTPERGGESCWVWGDAPDAQACYPSRFEGGVLSVVESSGWEEDLGRCVRAARGD